MGKHVWHIHIVKYYPDRKRNEVPTRTTTWMNLRNIVPRERGQTQKVIILYDSIYIKYPGPGGRAELGVTS